MVNFLLGAALMGVIMWALVGWMTRNTSKTMEARWRKDAVLALICARTRVGLVGEHPTVGDYINAKRDAEDIESTCWEEVPR